MLDLLKKYMKVKTEGKYSIFCIRELIVCICYGVIFYMCGTNGKMFEFNMFTSILYSGVAMFSSCEYITNKLYIDVNKGILKEEKFYKRVIESNIAILTEGFQYILVLIIIDIYFLGYIKSLKLLVQFAILIVLSLGIGNLIFVHSRNFNSKIKKNIIVFIVSLALALFLNYIYYKLAWIALLPLVLVIYPLSLKVSKNISWVYYEEF